MDADGLIIIVCRELGELKVASGTFEAGRALEAVFRSSRLISIRAGGLTSESFRVADDGSLMMEVGKGERPVPDGTYRLGRTRRGGEGRDLHVSGFVVRGGTVVSAQVDDF